MAGFQAGKPGPQEQARLAAGTGAILRTARTAAGLSAAELGRRANTNGSTVTAYESGRTRPSLTMLGRLARALLPADPDGAVMLLRRMATAAGSSLNRPQVAKGMAREQAVAVLMRAAQLLGFELDDDRVRGAVRQAIAELDQQHAPEPTEDTDQGHPMVRGHIAQIEPPAPARGSGPVEGSDVRF